MRIRNFLVEKKRKKCRKIFLPKIRNFYDIVHSNIQNYKFYSFIKKYYFSELITFKFVYFNATPLVQVKFSHITIFGLFSIMESKKCL